MRTDPEKRLLGAAILRRAPFRTAMSETYDFLFKFLVIGSAGTGKSCLLHQFIENKFKQDSNHTIGVEFGSKVVNVGGKTVKLQIWDTAGQERFRSVTRSYYRGAAGALLVYDITSRETYNALTNWLTDARTLASPNIVIILCGNKKDLDADREVTFLEASRFAQENELMFLETSALTGENVEEAFLKCARTILNKIESGELDPERMGSGIQYGDASLRHLRQPRGSAAPQRQPCTC
ncbi:ras-related protein Rab-4B isoform X2 [Cuculus canorus]|uniref:ras-related protein Rab-4B isoform X2 n=1 Tax=Cuculus canorus TaxID=55661 RepID=UPI0023AB05C9|nr:ras-related protein Rab-4B isoform X2 [Cuculus canorus]